ASPARRLPRARRARGLAREAVPPAGRAPRWCWGYENSRPPARHARRASPSKRRCQRNAYPSSPILVETGFVFCGPGDCSGSMERRAGTLAPPRAWCPSGDSVSLPPPHLQQYQMWWKVSYKGNHAKHGGGGVTERGISDVFVFCAHLQRGHFTSPLRRLRRHLPRLAGEDPGSPLSSAPKEMEVGTVIIRSFSRREERLSRVVDLPLPERDNASESPGAPDPPGGGGPAKHGGGGVTERGSREGNLLQWDNGRMKPRVCRLSVNVPACMPR